MTKQIVGDGPIQTVLRHELSRGGKAVKNIKTKIIRCIECQFESVVVSKPSVLSKALQSGCRACERARVAKEAQEALKARQRRQEEALKRFREKEANDKTAFDRLCKYCGVQWTSEIKKRGDNGHGSVCCDCRRLNHTRYKRTKTYGLSSDEQEALFPDGKATCMNPGCQKELVERGGTRDVTAVIDHCHDTGKVRGVLCTQCNIALGMLGESASRILGLHVYLGDS